ncbi:hypothetical protein C8R43DRAFT_1136748 [Mycena crocata]|nr:hypothetical protein C8R43DRAFT_1136748 [Mycena crocata]
MAPRTWHRAEHQPFFMEWLPRFMQRRSEHKLYKFWGPMFAAWFDEFPEHLGSDLLLLEHPADNASPSKEQLDALRDAIRRSRLAQLTASSSPTPLAVSAFSCLPSTLTLTSRVMAPRPWHGDEHQPFFLEYMPKFIQRQAQQKLYKFWGPMFEAWFEKFPEQRFLDLPMGEGAPPLSEAQVETLGKAISKRKQMLENYFRNNRAKLSTGAAKKHKSLYALARALFKAKPQRKRLHKAVELFQLRNNRLIQEECSREGHDSMNEESMAAAVANWVDEADEVQVARIKAAQAARMRLRNRVVHALFAEASDEELETIAELMEKEKEGEMVVDEDDDGMPVRTPAEYQASIDESWEVMKKVHAAIERMTGWYGFSIWGGPNPRIGGELSMKSVSFGVSPTGLDFEATHADFEKAVELPFQLFLRRCFPPDVRSKRSLDAVIPDKEPAEDTERLDSGFRLPNDDKLPHKAKPKRMTKSKKSAKAVASSTSPTTTTTTATSTPTAVASTTEPAASTPTAAPTQAAAAAPVPPVAGPISENIIGSGSTGDASPFTASTRTITSVSPNVQDGFDAFTGDAFMGLESFFEGDEFEMAGRAQDDDLGMPPLPSATMCWDTQAIEGYNVPSTSYPAQTTIVNGFNFPTVSQDPHTRMNNLFADYRRITQDSPTRSSDLVNFGNAATSLSLSAPRPSMAPAREGGAEDDSSPVPARFRRQWDSSPIRPTPSLGAGNAFFARPPLERLSFLTSAPPTSTPEIPQRLPPPAIAVTLCAASSSSNCEPAASGSVPGANSCAATLSPGGECSQALKIAAKVTEKKKNAGGRGRGRATAATAADESVDEAGDGNPTEGVLADTSNTLVYTTTNNSIKFDREVKARQAAAAAAKAPVVPNLLYNPDGPSDLVILTRPRRERQPRTNPDNTAVSLPVKRTLAERREMSNARTENALLARTGRLPTESSSVSATRGTSRRGRGKGR